MKGIFAASLSLMLALLLWTAAGRSEEFLKLGEPPDLGQPSTGAPDFVRLAKELSPAVVNISAEGEGPKEEENELSPFPNPKRDPNTPFRSLGSGFIIHPDGYIITNNHVVDKSERIVVRLLNDKSEYIAKLVGKDTKTDLALLKIKPAEKLHSVYLGDSDKLEVGQWVLAIGNQFQLGHTVSAGIVSALARKVRSSISNPYEAYIQTDASINPGSSGGPLFNVQGQVIGVNTAIFSPGRSGGAAFNIGIGFAVPINLVRSVILQLKEHGRVTRGLLGVIIQQIDNDLAQLLNLSNADGALVADIMEDTPASQADFKRKDVIVSFNGQKVKDYDDLPLMVANTKIGSKVNVGIIRDGQEKTLVVTIGELKEQAAKAESKAAAPNAIGVVVKDLDEELRAAFGKLLAGGVMVAAVEPGSPAGRAGVERGDIIAELAGQHVADQASFEAIVKGLDQSKPVLALIRKREGTRFLVLKFKKSGEAQPAKS